MQKKCKHNEPPWHHRPMSHTIDVVYVLVNNFPIYLFLTFNKCLSLCQDHPITCYNAPIFANFT